MDSILELIIKYSKEGKIIDRDVISFILEVGISLKELENYITKISFKGTPPSEEYLKPSSYLSFYRKLIIYEKELKRIKDKFIFIGNMSEFTKYFTVNMYITRILLYELENAVALKKSLSDTDDFESLYFRLWHDPENTFYKLTHSGILHFLRELPDFNPKILDSITATCNLYNEYYNTTLHNRLSNINSLNDIITMIKKSGVKTEKEILRIFQEELSKAYLSGYDLSSAQSSPTLELLAQYKERDIALNNHLLTETIASANELSKSGTPEERLRYGLLASKTEIGNLARIRRSKTYSPSY